MSKVRELKPRQLNFFDELVVDNFAGGGGASSGIEKALGRPVDIAINHDPEAILMHEVNHPFTKHYCENVWEIDPREVAAGRPVGLVWLSPDCKHFSKAKGGKPVEKKIRGLAWVAIRWAATVKPRMIMLENVEEFVTWGPLTEEGKPCPKNKGRTFNSFVNALIRLGYKVEWKELRVCDYGAPTTRKRLFLIARCDGEPIVWPKPTHGDPKSEAVRSGKLKPWRTAAEIIDWSLPCPSIFERKRPLAEATLRRIARGVKKFVLDAKEPFIVTCNHQGDSFRGQGLDKPFSTVTASRDAHGLVVPTLIQASYGERKGQAPRVPGLDKPLGTVVAGGIKHALVAASLIKHYAGNTTLSGLKPDEPLHTVTTQDHHSLVTANLIRHFGESVGSDLVDPVGAITAGGGGKTGIVTSNLVKFRGQNTGTKTDEPVPTITSGGTHIGEVRAFLMKYFGRGEGQSVDSPASTLTTKDRLALVTIDSVDYIIVDIGMRMLQPHELYAAQGFPSDYIIAPEFNGKRLSKTAQVRMVGNSVSPCVAAALVEANSVQDRRLVARG